jgi:protein-tyrosine phosphatase
MSDITGNGTYLSSHVEGTTVSFMTTPFNTDGGIHEIPVPSAVGSLWLCGKHYVAPEVNNVRQLHNIGTVVCLVEEHELVGRYDPYINWHRDNVGKGGLWFPIPDLTYPSLDGALEFVELVADKVCNRHNVLVHCAAGIGRAGTTATAVLMLLGMEMNEALTHVRHHRPMAGPETGSQTEFVMQLDEYLRDRDF